MAKTKISEYDSTAANNTDIDGINIAEGCAPSGINNAIRELMAHLKDMNIGSTITMLNTTEEDSDGGRANKIIFKGEQSGGEESTLAEIRASHDGTADDQKGDLIFKTNDGSDGASPTTRMVIDSAGDVGIGTAPSNGRLHIFDGNSDIAMDADASGQLHIDGNGYGFGVALNASAAQIYTNSASRDIVFGVNETEVMRVTDTSVGIGITPRAKLDIFGTGAGNARVLIEGEGGADPYINFLANNTQHWSIGVDDSDSDSFKIAKNSALGTNDYFVVDTSGNVGIGTNSPNLGSSGRGLHLKGPSGNATVLKIDSTTTSQEAQLQFTVDGSDKHRIASDTNGILEFVRSGIAVHGRFVPEGAFQVSDSGSFRTWTGNITSNQFIRGSQTQVTLTADSTHSAYIGSGFRSLTHRAATDAYNMIVCTTGNLSDDQFKVAGDGDVFCDGSFSGGGADYAEYFEWADGNTDNEDRVGFSVVLDNNKIRKATSSDDAANIIGVVSANPSVVGDADMDAWKHKYLRDDFGRFITDAHNVVEWTETIVEEEAIEEVLDDEGNVVTPAQDAVIKEIKHDYEDWNIPDDVTVPDDATTKTEDLNGNRFEHRRLNPDYDADKAYISRENRPEWATVGMMGKLRMRKGQSTGDRWIKMRDVSDSVEEWLVR